MMMILSPKPKGRPLSDEGTMEQKERTVETRLPLLQ